MANGRQLPPEPIEVDFKVLDDEEGDPEAAKELVGEIEDLLQEESDPGVRDRVRNLINRARQVAGRQRQALLQTALSLLRQARQRRQKQPQEQPSQEQSGPEQPTSTTKTETPGTTGSPQRTPFRGRGARTSKFARTLDPKGLTKKTIPPERVASPKEESPLIDLEYVQDVSELRDMGDPVGDFLGHGVFEPLIGDADFGGTSGPSYQVTQQVNVPIAGGLTATAIIQDNQGNTGFLFNWQGESIPWFPEDKNKASMFGVV